MYLTCDVIVTDFNIIIDLVLFIYFYPLPYLLSVHQSYASILSCVRILIVYIEAKDPFASPPFEHFVSLFFRDSFKFLARKYRVIHDLFFPKHHSVNHHIPQENSSVQYESIINVTPLFNHNKEYFKEVVVTSLCASKKRQR